MINIDNELLDDIKTDKLLPLDNEIFEVSLLIKELDIQIDESLINTLENQYLVITDFIIDFYLQKKQLPINIKNLIENSYNYKLFLLENIENRMKKIINENSIYIFKEVYIVLNLLSFGNTYEILTKENLFSIDGLKTMLLEYESRISTYFYKKDEKNFDLSFKYYLTTLEVLNEISVINSLDIQRKKNINELLELIASSISSMKIKIKLEDKYLDSLNAVLGKLLLYFTNMPYVPIDEKDILIKKYTFMLEKVFEGYNLLNANEKYYLSFLDKVSSLILTLIYKLKIKLNIENINFNENEVLCSLYKKYNDYVEDKHKIKSDNLNDFRDKLVLNYKYLYDTKSNSGFIGLSHPLDFFINRNFITNLDMIVLYDSILYSDEIKKEKLDSIMNMLLTQEKFNNDYYELYKLKIIDRVLQKYISLRIRTKDNIYISKVIDYVEHNNLVSHLMSMYSKIYLSLSLYYSYEKEEQSQEISKKYYYRYKRFDEKGLLLNEFSNINNQIIKNYASNYFKQMSMHAKNKFNNEELLRIGEKLISEYINKKQIETINEIFFYIEELRKEIHDKNESNNKYIFEKIEKLIEEKIFLGFVKVKLTNIDETKEFNDIGFENTKVDIYEEYILYFYYSSFYKAIFETTFNKNKHLLELIVKNCFKTYMNTIPSYTDTITLLPNIKKLKDDLEKNKKKKITFFEIYLNTVVDFSNKNNVKKSDEFFKHIVQIINEQYSSYRLTGPKIAIILDDEKEDRFLIEYLLNLEIEFENRKYKLDSVIAISKGEPKNILDKSFYTLSSAKLSEEKLFIFE